MIWYLLCHQWEASSLRVDCAARACLIYAYHRPFYSDNLILSSALSAPHLPEISSPHTNRSCIQQQRYLVNISSQIHSQIPPFKRQSWKSNWGQTITLLCLISWGALCYFLLPHLIPASPPSTWSERRYRTTELQMPLIRLGDRSEALSGPLHDITVTWSWWKDKLFEIVAHGH